MRARSIDKRHVGIEHGFIRRIVSPEDIGERLKPFVFLDFTHGKIPENGGFGFHPHSGIATITYQQAVELTYEDTTGQNGIVKARGLEWVNTGGCIWHRAGMKQVGDNAIGFQLWIALPPDQEQGTPSAMYIPPSEVKSTEGVQVLLGEYSGVQSQIKTPYPVNYFDVSLRAGIPWSYVPPEGHDVVWAFIYSGVVHIGEVAVCEELVIFDREPGEVRALSDGPAGLMLGTAPRHPYPLVVGRNSVHTSAEALHASEQRIAAMGAELRKQGRM